MRRIKKLLATGLTCALAATSLTGCSGPATSVNMPQQRNVLEKDAPDQSGQQAEPDASRIAGKVVETMNAGGYTYLCLERGDGKKLWAAVPATKITTGEEVEIQPGMKMANFTSKALNRTFEIIIFSEGIVQK